MFPQTDEVKKRAVQTSQRTLRRLNCSLRNHRKAVRDRINTVLLRPLPYSWMEFGEGRFVWRRYNSVLETGKLQEEDRSSSDY